MIELPEMPASLAILIWEVSLKLNTLGFDIPANMVLPLEHAEATLLEAGFIEPYICSHGHAKVRPTPELFEALR